MTESPLAGFVWFEGLYQPGYGRFLPRRDYAGPDIEFQGERAGYSGYVRTIFVFEEDRPIWQMVLRHSRQWEPSLHIPPAVRVWTHPRSASTVEHAEILRRLLHWPVGVAPTTHYDVLPASEVVSLAAA